MNTVYFALLIAAAYLLGAMPLSYLAARRAKGIDLRKYGTGQVGAGNLYRTTSRKLGFTVALFDIAKGIIMIAVAHALGFSAGQQLIVGIAALVGHNWSVFLRFSGGRGIGTTGGVILILPLLNDVTIWGMLSFVAIGGLGLLIFKSSPLPVIIGIALLPVISFLAQDPASVTPGYLLLLLIVAMKRVLIPVSPEARSLNKGTLALNRLLFDRDIRDRKAWMARKPEGGAVQ
ncbi:MAG: glycerol-3-phosphate acyltransferase [Chloroflexota bacterium]